MNILGLISQLIGIKTLRLTNTYYKIHKLNQRAKEEKNCIFHTQTTIEVQGVKKNLSAASPIVGAVGSGEFK